MQLFARGFIVGLILCCLGSVGIAQERLVPRSRGDLLLSFAPLVKRTAPSVVNVYAQQIVVQRESSLSGDPFFRRFFDRDGTFGRARERVANSLGSGVIVEGNGLIVTNNHVVRNGVDIRVVLADKREFEAKILLADERTDLAVLKIDIPDAEELPSLRLADSDNLEVGDLVLAIGNPFGVGQTVTSGIVSALARTQVGVTDYQFFIQTDAAINPGNSGGALVNMDGELVGINTAIFSRSGGSIGIGFSIPTNMVRTVVQSAAAGQKIRRPWLGAEFQDVTQDIAESLGFARPEGALIVKVNEKSPLMAAGMRRGDVITAIDDKVVENAQELGYRVATSNIGASRLFEFHRGKRVFEAQVKMIAAPESPLRNLTRITGVSPLTGLVVGNLSPALADEVGLSAEVAGVVVVEAKDEPSSRFFRKGDIILNVNGVDIRDVVALRDVLRDPPRGWDIEVSRSGRTLRLRLR